MEETEDKMIIGKNWFCTGLKQGVATVPFIILFTGNIWQNLLKISHTSEMTSIRIWSYYLVRKTRQKLRYIKHKDIKQHFFANLFVRQFLE